ncbi:MAG TPA: CoA-binding protein [Actinobacteria bacterium]|jgi:acyl-CoA synthetase (NDP forming)|nr:CoA-binding protein [Actinomycetota bacterium]
MSSGGLEFLHNPSSVAVIGASDDPDKIGGRPIAFMQRFGYQGTIMPVNPSRATVQGLTAYPDVASLPSVPDAVIVALPGQAAVDAVDACAALGVKGGVVMASGFGETGRADDLARQQDLVARANSRGMRLVGPNSQGLANFGTGTILSFSTMFVEQEPLDGPIAIVSQSGAMASVPYGLLRRRGLGVRYVHGTGNDADLGVGDLAEAVLHDPDIRLVLLYLEDIRDPRALERAAALALERDVPIVAMMGGRSADGRRAASSHTGALANEQRVVDAFLARTGIWRARSLAGMVDTAALYLQDWRPRGRRLAIVSNSGAICVLGADAAADNDLELSTFAGETTEALATVLPAFATKANPVDITAALLTDSSLFSKVLPILAGDPEVDAAFIGIPVSGKGYDFPRFAADTAEFARRDNKPVVVAVPQETVAAEFRARGLVVFDDEATALTALGQYLHHRDLMANALANGPLHTRRPVSGQTEVLSEAAALSVLRDAGIPTVEVAVCSTAEEARAAFERFGDVPVAVKGCPNEATHKSELGLVRLGLTTVDAVADAADDLLRTMDALGLEAEGVLVSPMVSGITEGLIGAHVDPVFGPVVLVGAGGKYVEALDDVQALIPPFSAADARAAIGRLRIAPLLAGVRGEPPTDIEAWVSATLALSRLILADPAIQSVDVNPLMVGAAEGESAFGALAVDAVVERIA